MEKVGENLREKILIVQDYPSGKTATPELVSRSGYATALVRETPRAVEKIGQESPDLVILDMGMAIPERLDLLTQLKSDRSTQHIPIFVVGTPSATASRTQWISSGADDFLDYPYHEQVLNARIRAILRRYVVCNPVTLLPSGAYLQRQVDPWLSKNTPTVLLSVDIDHFTSYNSAYGRQAGDRVLRHLARLIVDVLPNGTMSVAHMGEDDFMMAFPPDGVETYVQTLVDRFRAAQKDFYNETDFARGYIPEYDPSLPPRNWPLMTLSAAMVSNRNQPLISFVQACSLLNKVMTHVKAGKGEPDYIPERPVAKEAGHPTPFREGRCQFYQRVCEELRQANLREFDEYSPLVGSHFSDAGDHERAARFFRIAGDWAQRQFAPAKARAQYENALTNLAQLPDSHEHLRQRMEASTRYAMVGYGSDAPKEILARLTAVESLAQDLEGLEGTGLRRDRLTLGQLRLWIGRILNITNQPLEGIAYCQQVLDESQELGEEEFSAVASGEIGLALARQGYYGKAIPLLLPGIAHFEQERDWQQWTYLVGHLALSLVATGEVAAGLAHAEAMMKRAVDLKSKSALAVSQLFLSFIYLLGGEIDKSLAASQACVETASEVGALFVLSMGYEFRAWAESLLGQLVAAAKSLSLQEETARQLGGQAALADQFAAIAAEINLRQGSAEKALPLAEQAVELARQMKGVFAEALGERVLAKAIAASNPMQYDVAERHLISSVNAFESGDCWVEVARTRVVWGLLAAARGKVATARKQLERAASQFEAAGLGTEATETSEILLALMPPIAV